MKNMIKPKTTVEMTSKPSILSNLALRTDYGGSLALWKVSWRLTPSPEDEPLLL
jgi:hypothetical protein